MVNFPPHLSQSVCRALPVWAACAILAPWSLIGSLARAAEPASSQKTEDLVSQLVANSQKHQVVRKSDPADLVRQAEVHAVGLADDVSLYNTWMLQIIRAHLEKKQPEDAEYLVKRLPGHGGAMAHAEMALHYSRSGRKPESEAHLKKALQLVEKANGLPAEMARIDCILALHHLERGQETAALVVKLGKLALLTLETQMHEQDLMKPVTLLDAKRRLVEVPEQGEDERRARYLLACAKQHYQKAAPEVAVMFLDEIGQMSVQNGLPNAHRVLVDLARVAWTGGQPKLARRSLNLFFKCCEAYGDGADWKPVFIADGVEVLIEWYEKDEALEWLRAGEKSIAKVFVLDAAAALLALAAQHEKLGDTASADRLIKLALQSVSTYKHPRVRAEAAVRTCLYYNKAGRAMPEPISQLLSLDTAEAAK